MSFQCYCGNCSIYIVVILPFIEFYLCFSYFLYLVYYSSEVLYLPPGQDSWYVDISYFLHHGTCPKNINRRERRTVRIKSTQYCLINYVIFWLNCDGVLRRCLEQDDSKKVLKEIHDGLGGGNFARETNAHKILRVGYYWPTLFMDPRAYERIYKTFQLSIGKEKKLSIPLQTVNISRPFEQWGINFVG